MLSLPPSREVVLEYIVERKRMDDLAGSIVDGRYREQKVTISCAGLSLLLQRIPSLPSFA